MNTPVLPPLSPLPSSPTHDYNEDMLQLLGSPFNLPDDMASVLSSDTPLSTGSDLARAMDPPSPEPSPGPSPDRTPGVSPTFSPSASPPSEVANLAAWTPSSGGRLTSLPDATLDQMNKEELREYAEALKSLAEKYPQVKETLTPTIKNVMMRVDGRWRGNRSEKRMNLDEVEEYVKELEATDQSKFDETSQMRIRYALEKALARRLQLRKEAEQDRRNGGDDDRGWDDPGGDDGDDDDDGGGDDDDDANDDHGERFKNADQDTVSKALSKKLGKGDHQTIANTTTVTTVRRGKRPVVEREHNSQTFPGPGSDNDDDDDGGDDATIEGGVLRRKRKSRVSKSKPRRKKHSQQGGYNKTPHEVVDQYIRFLRDAKRKKLS
ncbi:uncharacterized protein LOC116289732 [Actinia tenebrosa]|uniref:Uncharacterized protein LOC116289732 n=1 Tax=Actinia tenebrosa TaxID=6105 RepID=A0A6P8HBM6_ACTTE|nr:uncharacterized protein LOC116289732 [Actinia tenebrosa]